MRKLSRWPCCYIKRLHKMENWNCYCDPQVYRKDFIRRCSQTFTTLFRPIKGFICNCNTDPPSIFKTSSTLGKKSDFQLTLNKDRDWVFEIYFKLLPDTIGYIRWNHYRNTPSTTNYSRTKNETTNLNTESALQSAASNDDENEIEMLTISNKRTFNEDSSEEDTTNPLPAKKAATSSPASEQSGTRVPKRRGGRNLPKISAFPANTSKSGGQGSSQGDIVSCTGSPFLNKHRWGIREFCPRW